MLTKTVARSALGLGGSGALELAGTLPEGPRVGIVGSRAAHRSYLELVPSLVEAAGRAGYAVVSGGALGIDAAAHRAALAAEIRQLAVIPSAPERPYPPSHEALFVAIAGAKGSGVLFSLKAGQAPCRAVFASRNSLVISLVDALVVVEAARSSGSFGSGREALRRGRPVAAALGSSGGGALVAGGAAAIETKDGAAAAGAQLEAWLRAVAARPRVEIDGRGGKGRSRVAGQRALMMVSSQAVTAPWPEHLAWLAKALVAAGEDGVTVDSLADEDPSMVMLGLLEAEGLGLIVEEEIGRYRSARPIGGEAA